MGVRIAQYPKIRSSFYRVIFSRQFFFWFVSVEIVAFYSSQLIRNILRSKFELNYVDGENIGKLI